MSTVSGVYLEDFPYKREFIDPERLWENILSDTCSEIVSVNPNGWRRVSPGIQWEFMGEPIGCITYFDAYDKVNKLVDYFSERARMRANRRGRVSPIQFYKENYRSIILKAEELSDGTLPIRYWIREAVYRMATECTAFKISTTKSLLEFFHSRRVLDPSGGWGDRLLGAAAANVLKYHAVDPNPNLIGPYREMIEFVSERRGEFECTFDCEDFLRAEIESESYDTVFTSPPFFDYEVYVNDPKQSIHNRKSVKKWTAQFLYPYIRKSWDALIPGGHLILYISDTRDRYTKNMYRFINRELNGDFLGIIASAYEDQRYALPIWVWRK